MRASILQLITAGFSDETIFDLFKDQGDPERSGDYIPVKYSTILEKRGLDDCILALAHGGDDEKLVLRLSALAFVMRLEHLTQDPRVRECNRVNHLYIHGEATLAELETAREAVGEAACEAMNEVDFAAIRKDKSGEAMASAVKSWAARDAADCSWRAAWNDHMVSYSHAAKSNAFMARWASNDKAMEKKEQEAILMSLLFQMEKAPPLHEVAQIHQFFENTQIQQFYEDLLADGWKDIPQPEMYDHLVQFTKDEFIVSIFNSKAVDGESAHAWGPDALSLELPMPYDFEQMKRNLRKCGICGREDVDTQRVAYADRVCAKCLPAARKSLERPGWSS